MKPEPKSNLEGDLRRNAMQLLVCADARSRQSAGEIASRGQWRELLDLCERWKLLPNLEARLAALNLALPEAESEELGLRTQLPFVRTMLSVRAGTIALRALQDAGIRCAGFKGLATLAHLYPGPRSRTLQDVDVLIPPRDVEAALLVLEQAGLKRPTDTPWEEYVAFLKNSPGTAGNEAVTLLTENGGAVDLHWRLGALDVETLLAGAAIVPVLNRPVSLMSPGHCMMLSAHHALRNDFVPDEIARDVCDFALWQALLTSSQWQSLAADAQSWGLSAACAALAAIAAELCETPNAESPLPVSRADQAAARQLAALYFHQLSAGAINTDLAYVASARPFLQILSGLAGGWKQYRESMRRSEEFNGEVSLSVRERLWKLGKALTALSPASWRQVRVLARAKNKMAQPPPPHETPPRV